MIQLGDSGLRSAREKCEKLGFNGNPRVLLLCVDPKTSKCASGKQMAQSWKHLKRSLKERKLSGRGGVLRMKTACVGICRGGPIMAVMPDGIWYGRCTPKTIDRIIQEHLIDGEIIDEFVIARPPENWEEVEPQVDLLDVDLFDDETPDASVPAETQSREFPTAHR